MICERFYKYYKTITRVRQKGSEVNMERKIGKIIWILKEKIYKGACCYNHKNLELFK